MNRVRSLREYTSFRLLKFRADREHLSYYCAISCGVQQGALFIAACSSAPLRCVGSFHRKQTVSCDTEGQATGKKRGSEDEWEVVDKSETLADSSYVGPATFADSVASQPASPAPGANAATDEQPPAEATGVPACGLKVHPRSCLFPCAGGGSLP